MKPKLTQKKKKSSQLTGHINSGSKTPYPSLAPPPFQLKSKDRQEQTPEISQQSGTYEQAIQEHKENVAHMGTVLDRMSNSKDITQKNTAEILKTNEHEEYPKVELRILTQTHDSTERSQALGYPNFVSYFGADKMYPDNEASYPKENKAADFDGLFFLSPSTAGEASANIIRIPNAKRQSESDLQSFLVHESQHVLDHHEDTKGYHAWHEKPEHVWELYKTEFRAYWVAENFNPNLANYKAEKTGFKNALQEKIFNHMRKHPEYNSWLGPNYEQNTEVNGKKFQDLVHAYAMPEGINLINSARIDDLYLALRNCNPSAKDMSVSPLKEVMLAAKALNSHDRAHVNSKEAIRLQNLMKTKLDKEVVLGEVAKIVNGGKKPGWCP